MGRRLQCEVGRRVSHRPVGVLLPCAVAPCRSRTQCSRRACCAGASTWLKIFARLIAPKWRCRQSWSLHGIPGLCLGFSCYLTPNLRCCGRRANGLIVGLRRGGVGLLGPAIVLSAVCPRRLRILAEFRNLGHGESQISGPERGTINGLLLGAACSRAP